jgi:hypothetical protein
MVMLDSTQKNIDLALLWLGVSLLVLAILTGLAAALLYATASAETPAMRSVIVTSRATSPATHSANETPLPVWFRQFALNALLAPLIDDAEPARWSDVALDFMCDPSTRVLVDGKPMVSGTPVPTKAFSIRWDMNHCEPMGPGTPLSGGVDLLVSYERSGLTAVVIPDRLQVHGPRGRSSVVGPFTAGLSLVRTSFDH